MTQLNMLAEEITVDISRVNKMKTYLFAMAIVLFAVSCSTATKNKVEGTDAQAVASGTGEQLTVDVSSSSILWKGSKVGGEHVGAIALKNGSLAVKGQEVGSGSFIIDMNSIVDNDLPTQVLKDQLTNHLKSADFFDVATYPESTFTITKVEAAPHVTDSITHTVSGNLKLKDVEKNITFGAKVTKEGDVYKAISVPFTIDRTQWNVKYGSKTLFANLKENIVNDNIELQITIVAKTTK